MEKYVSFLEIWQLRLEINVVTHIYGSPLTPVSVPLPVCGWVMSVGILWLNPHRPDPLSARESSNWSCVIQNILVSVEPLWVPRTEHNLIFRTSIRNQVLHEYRRDSFLILRTTRWWVQVHWMSSLHLTHQLWPIQSNPDYLGRSLAGQSHKIKNPG